MIINYFCSFFLSFFVLKFAFLFSDLLVSPYLFFLYHPFWPLFVKKSFAESFRNPARLAITPGVSPS
jgi:hypothetical protein